MKKNENIKHLRICIRKENPERKGFWGKLKVWKPKYIEILSLEKNR